MKYGKTTVNYIRIVVTFKTINGICVNQDALISVLLFMVSHRGNNCIFNALS